MVEPRIDILSSRLKGLSTAAQDRWEPLDPALDWRTAGAQFGSMAV
jgi:hypothetical protein